MQHCASRLVGRALYVVFFGLAQIITEIESTCPSPYYPSTHTACLNPSPYSGNPKGVTPTEQATIVAEHNKYRASVDATDMQMMYWDKDLAFVAQKLAENCTFAHDPQREILCKYSAGQNIALGYSNWDGAVQGWYNETYKFTYGSSTNIFSEIGHYTQVMWSSSAKVGCGSSYCSNYNQKIHVCNYAPPGNFGPSLSRPYTAGARCSACPNHCNNGLCDCGGLVCKNGGVLDINTCTCSCRTPYQGSADCNLNCSGVTDASYCNLPRPNGYPPAYCSIYTNVPQECPFMCGVCPGSACLELQAIVLGDQTTSSSVVSTAGIALPAATTSAGTVTATPGIATTAANPAATTATINPIPAATTAVNNPTPSVATAAGNSGPIASTVANNPVSTVNATTGSNPAATTSAINPIPAATTTVNSPVPTMATTAGNPGPITSAAANNPLPTVNATTGRPCTMRRP